jgi:hypothetical protein
MKDDTDLETRLRDSFISDPSSEAVNSFSVVAEIRRELLQQKEVWEHGPRRRVRDIYRKRD